MCAVLFDITVVTYTSNIGYQQIPIFLQLHPVDFTQPNLITVHSQKNTYSQLSTEKRLIEIGTWRGNMVQCKYTSTIGCYLLLPKFFKTDLNISKSQLRVFSSRNREVLGRYFRITSKRQLIRNFIRRDIFVYICIMIW